MNLMFQFWYIGNTDEQDDNVASHQGLHCLLIQFLLKDENNNEPEDQWSCKRSPDIWALYKHESYKTWLKMTEQTTTLITHNPSFIHLVNIINQISGHRMQLFLKYPSLSHFPI